MFQKLLSVYDYNWGKYRWYHGVIFFIVVNILTFAWVFTDRQYYLDLNKPWFAPPTWFFSVAWTVNNIFVIAGNIWTLNLKPNRVRTALLFVQDLSWLNYILFSALSFGTKIPAMFFWPTLSMWVLTIISIVLAVQLDKSQEGGFWATVKRGRSIAFSFATLIVWLSIATALGYYVWMNN